MLVIYVDDFKLAARKGDHGGLWKEIRSVIDMDPDTDDGRFLGCCHVPFEAPAYKVKDLIAKQPWYHPRPPKG